MLLSFQSRFHMPWRDVAMNIYLDTIVPLFAVPLFIALACLNLYITIIMLLASCALLNYTYHLLKSARKRSPFFLVWITWSVIFMTFLFEMTVPLYELLPEENLILVILAFASFYCFYKVKKHAWENHVQQQYGSKKLNELPGITKEAAEQHQQQQLLAEEQDSLLLEMDEIIKVADEDEEEDNTMLGGNNCKTCRKHLPAHSFHCSLCQACIKGHKHHSYWLDCCIGADNYCYYLFGLIFGEIALLFGSNLTLTAICHPFLFVRIFSVSILLPNDCRDVYALYELAPGFVCSIYAIIIAVYIAYVLSMLAYYRCRRRTRNEFLNNRKRAAKSWQAFFC